MTTYAVWSSTDKINAALSTVNYTNDQASLANDGINMGFIRANGGGVDTGKYYFEIYHSANGYSQNVMVGIANDDALMYSGVPDGTLPSTITKYFGHDGNAWTIGVESNGASTKYACNNANHITDGVSSGSYNFNLGVRMGCAFDLATGYVWFSINGTWVNSGNPATGANPTLTGVNGGSTGIVRPCASVGLTNISLVLVCDPAFYSTTNPAGFGYTGVPLLTTVAQTFTKPSQALAGIANTPPDDYYSWFKDRQ